jgi:hypothetical protein
LRISLIGLSMGMSDQHAGYTGGCTAGGLHIRRAAQMAISAPDELRNRRTLYEAVRAEGWLRSSRPAQQAFWAGGGMCLSWEAE